MDLLFKRYASPFILLDELIAAGRFAEYIRKIHEKSFNEKEDAELWEFFLHKVYDKSWSDFIREIKPQQPKVNGSINLEATVKDSWNMLKEFDIKE